MNDAPQHPEIPPHGGIRTKTCPDCGAAFSCGGACWCAVLPPVFPVTEHAACYCPGCLARRAAAIVRGMVENLTPETAEKIRALGPVERPVRGIDYDLDARGFMVFTAWYHLRRGECCGNGCRHCPYPEQDDT